MHNTNFDAEFHSCLLEVLLHRSTSMVFLIYLRAEIPWRFRGVCELHRRLLLSAVVTQAQEVHAWIGNACRSCPTQGYLQHLHITVCIRLSGLPCPHEGRSWAASSWSCHESMQDLSYLQLYVPIYVVYMVMFSQDRCQLTNWEASPPASSPSYSQSLQAQDPTSRHSRRSCGRSSSLYMPPRSILPTVCTPSYTTNRS